MAKENLAKKAIELDSKAKDLLGKINASLQKPGDVQANQAVKDAIEDTKKGEDSLMSQLGRSLSVA